jgi:hypothetical protein
MTRLIAPGNQPEHWSTVYERASRGKPTITAEVLPAAADELKLDDGGERGPASIQP